MSTLRSVTLEDIPTGDSIDIVDLVPVPSQIAAINVAINTINSTLGDESDFTKGAAVVGRATQTVPTYAALRGLLKTTKAKTVYVEGNSSYRDGGEGIFTLDEADITTPEDYGTVLVATDGGRWKRHIGSYISLKWFGAKMDGVTDDQVALDRFTAVWIKGYIDGYIPTGVCLISGRWVVDLLLNPSRICPRLFGDGPYSSTIHSTYTGPLSCFEIARTIVGLDVSAFQGSFDRIGFRGDTPNILASLGKADFSDNLGNFQFKQVFWGNGNSTNGVSAITLQVNYLFDCVFDNCVMVGKPQYGAALWLRKAVFCNFTNGSYSNAANGIYITDGGSHNITFVTPDMENINFALYVDDPAAERIQLINPYMDIWDPVSMTYPPSAYPIFVGQAQVGGVTVDDARFARDQSFLYAYIGHGTPGAISPTTTYANLNIRGKYPGQTSKPVAATDVGVLNNTGQVQLVNCSATTSVFINGQEFPGSGGMFILNPGDIIALRYTVAPYWSWKALW
ncbi:hypothetical protein D3C77_37610 [compost metagenome]